MRWVRVVGYGDAYQVSDSGEVRSVDRLVNGRRLKGVVLRQTISNRGYCRVTLSEGGKSYTLLVHRVVAGHFIPNPEGRLQVNHLDECKLNNNVSNLKWCTPQENVHHSIHKYKGRPKTVLGKIRKCY